MEVLVAVVILASAGVSAMTFLAQFSAAQSGLIASEQEILDVEQTLIATSLLSARDLDQRLGRRTLGQHVVSVARPEPALYRIGVAHVDSPVTELLSMVVYRPREGRE